MMYIKKVVITNHTTNKKTLQYGLYDYFGFICSAEKSLNKLVNMCIKENIKYEVLI